MNTRHVARVIAGYHAEHGLPQDKDRDWFWAEECIRMLGEEFQHRKLWESGRSPEGDMTKDYWRSKKRVKMTIKELVYVFLDNCKYAYTGKPIKGRLIWTMRAWLQDGLISLMSLWKMLMNFGTREKGN
jgi:hypothetical protein